MRGRMLKKIWRDPVWSKVIATGILGGILALVGAIYSESQGWFPTIGQWIASESKIPNWLLIISCGVIFWKITDIGRKIFYHGKKGTNVSTRNDPFMVANRPLPTSRTP